MQAISPGSTCAAQWMNSLINFIFVNDTSKSILQSNSQYSSQSISSQFFILKSNLVGVVLEEWVWLDQNFHARSECTQLAKPPLSKSCVQACGVGILCFEKV